MRVLLCLLLLSACHQRQEVRSAQSVTAPPSCTNIIFREDWLTREKTGFVYIFEDTKGRVLQAHITPELRDCYNTLIELYGHRFNPPLTNDQDLIIHTEVGWNDYWIMRGTAYSNLFLMNRWQSNRSLQILKSPANNPL